jgi:hypothetical protein
MAFTITYRTLFSLDCWHHFFLDDDTGNFMGLSHDKRSKIANRYNVADFMSIRATADTQHKMQGHQLIFKTTRSGFLLASKADPFDVSKMFNPLSGNQILRFVISTNQPAFHNYTNGQLKSQSLYYFSNHNQVDASYPGLSQWPSVFDAGLAGTMSGDGDPDTFAYPPGSMLVDTLPDPKVLKLSKEATNANFTDNTIWKKDLPADLHDASTAYAVGDRALFTQAGTDSVYEAIQDTSGNPPTDASMWTKITDLPLQYANENDLTSRLGSFFSYTIPNSGDTYRFEVLDVLDQVLLSKVRKSEKDGELYQLDLNQLPSAGVKIQVIDVATDITVHETNGICLQPSDSAEKPVGIIEIIAAPAAGNYRLLDVGNNFLSPRYELRFKNRSTVWQYYDENEMLVTATPEPRPLIHRGYQKITHDGVDLPNPEVQMIRPTPQQTYSEIFI